MGTLVATSDTCHNCFHACEDVFIWCFQQCSNCSGPCGSISWHCLQALTGDCVHLNWDFTCNILYMSGPFSLYLCGSAKCHMQEEKWLWQKVNGGALSSGWAVERLNVLECRLVLHSMFNEHPLMHRHGPEGYNIIKRKLQFQGSQCVVVTGGQC
jgi:hypothetical protein